MKEKAPRRTVMMGDGDGEDNDKVAEEVYNPHGGGGRLMEL